MSKKQLVALFFPSFAMFTAGNGLIPLLPIYAIQLGAETAIAGYYLSFSYFMLAVGVFIAGWLSDLYQKRKRTLFIGFALTGYAIQTFGVTSTFISGAFLPFIAIILLIIIRQNTPVEDLDKVMS